MSDSCEKCEKALPTGTERTLGTCVSCLQELKRLAADQAVQLESVKSSEAALREKTTGLEAALARLTRLNQAEKLGSQAALSGADESENPYVKGSEEFLLWESGFTVSSLTNEFDQFRAMLLWSLNVLDHVEELARGYGQEEIATKIATVLEKYAQQFPELLEEKAKQEKKADDLAV